MEKLKLAYDFNKEVGLPTCLADLELEKDDPLEDVAADHHGEPGTDPYTVSGGCEDVHEAILKLEDYRG